MKHNKSTLGQSRLVLMLGLSILLISTLSACNDPLIRDAPRDLPWVLPDYRDAKFAWQIDESGRINNEVEHLFLADISPKMVAWFYQQLPISTVELNGVKMPLYHIFHPVGHGRIFVVEPAADGKPGMAQGATIMREEWFGPFDSKGAATLAEFSDEGMLALAKIGPIEMGEVRHSYSSKNGGTYYTVKAVIGSDLPVVGRLLNWYARTYIFHPEMMSQWQQHQVEEVASLRFFLKEIYAQRENKNNHYVLNIPTKPD